MVTKPTADEVGYHDDSTLPTASDSNKPHGIASQLAPLPQSTLLCVILYIVHGRTTPFSHIFPCESHTISYVCILFYFSIKFLFFFWISFFFFRIVRAHNVHVFFIGCVVVVASVVRMRNVHVLPIFFLWVFSTKKKNEKEKNHFANVTIFFLLHLIVHYSDALSWTSLFVHDGQIVVPLIVSSTKHRVTTTFHFVCTVFSVMMCCACAVKC